MAGTCLGRDLQGLSQDSPGPCPLLLSQEVETDCLSQNGPKTLPCVKTSSPRGPSVGMKVEGVTDQTQPSSVYPWETGASSPEKRFV